MAPKFELSMCIILFISSLIVSYQMAGTVLLCLAPRWDRRYQAWLESIWVDAVGKLLHPTRLIVSGDCPNPSEPAVFICNHQVDADWWFMWILARFFKMHGHVKIVLKHSLKWIPLLGQGMQTFDFIFLQRDLKKDAPMLDLKVKGFLRDQFPFWILLFPEGTTVHSECIARSHEYAEKEHRPVLAKTVLPRVNGFKTVLDALPDSLKVYDCTMVYGAYTGEIPDWSDGYSRKKDKDIPNLRKLFSGMRTPPTYVHIKTYTAGEIKQIGIQKWLDDCWVAKDNLLLHYATTGHMPEAIEAGKHLDVTDAGSFLGAAKLFACQLLLLVLFIMWWYEY